jgi:phosphomannomutase
MMMSDAPLIVGVSGLRGIVGESLTPEVAVRYAGAFANWLWAQPRLNDRPTVFLARDGRKGGEAIAALVRGALLSSGCDVIDIGVATTPSAGMAMRLHIDSDGCMIITASHNPSEWNGLKLLITDRKISQREIESMSEGEIESFQNALVGPAAPPKEIVEQIIGCFERGASSWCGNDSIGVLEVDADSTERHAEWVVQQLPSEQFMAPLSSEFRVVVDSVNCSGAAAASMLIEKLGSSTVQLHGDESGIFPHTPEPTAENLSGAGGLCDAVPGLKADVGFAQDPDADRLAIVDEHGRYIGEEYTLALCAEAVLSAMLNRAQEGGGSPSPRPSPHGGEGGGAPVLVANLSTSRMIDDVAAKHGGRVVRTPVGEANVVEVMKKLKFEGQNVVLGGEGNGGVIWPEVVYVRDSLGSMALVLSLMARTGKTVSELVARINSYSPGADSGNGGGGYAIVKRKVEIASKADARPAVEAVAAHFGGRADATIDLQDGVRVDLPEKGVWVHVRASNTEPIMRLIAEAPTKADAGAILAEVEGAIAG